jgi:hypothetical protein
VTADSSQNETATNVVVNLVLSDDVWCNSGLDLLQRRLVGINDILRSLNHVLVHFLNRRRVLARLIPDNPKNRPRRQFVLTRVLVDKTNKDCSVSRLNVVRQWFNNLGIKVERIPISIIEFRDDDITKPVRSSIDIKFRSTSSVVTNALVWNHL